MENEVESLCHLNHPNIIKIYDVGLYADYKHTNGKVTQEHYIALELAPNGELFDYIYANEMF